MFSAMKLVHNKYDELYFSPPTFHLKKTKDKSPSTEEESKKEKRYTLERPKQKGIIERTDVTMRTVPPPTILG